MRPFLRCHVRACARHVPGMCQACAGLLGWICYCARRARACAGSCALCFGVSIVRTCAHSPTHMPAHARTCGTCASLAYRSLAHARTCLCTLPADDSAGPHMHAHALNPAPAHARTCRCTCTHMPAHAELVRTSQIGRWHMHAHACPPLRQATGHGRERTSTR